MTRSRYLHISLGAALVLLAGGLYWAVRGKNTTGSPPGGQTNVSVLRNSYVRASENTGRNQQGKYREVGREVMEPRAGSFGFSNSVTGNSNGLLTTKTIEELDLTSEEVKNVTTSIKNMMDQAAADFVQRTRLTDSRSNGANSSYTYFTPARPDRGQAFLKAFLEETEAIVGEERSRKLLEGMDSFGYAGGMGRYDLETEIIRGEGGSFVRQNYLEPDSGRVLCSSEGSPISFRERFGDLFDVTGEK